MKAMLMTLIAAITLSFTNFVNVNSTDSAGTQSSIKEIAKTVASENCTDEQCFVETLQAIAWQESSFGKNLIGDSKKTVYFYKEDGKHIPISKDVLSSLETDNHVHVSINGETKQVFSHVQQKELSDSSLGTFQIKVNTAKYVIEKMKLSEFYYLLENESELVYKLLLDIKFGAKIAVNYLKLNYNNAVRSGIQDPWFHAVSKYNGGSNNYNYVNAIRNKMNRLEDV